MPYQRSDNNRFKRPFGKRLSMAIPRNLAIVSKTSATNDFKKIAIARSIDG